MTPLRVRRVCEVLFATALMVVPTLSSAQDLRDLLGTGKSGGSNRAAFTMTVTPETAAPGAEVTVSVHAKLPAGFYIYGTDGNFGGRTRITVEETPGVEWLDAFRPDREEKPKHDASLDAEVVKFHDEVTWTRRARLSATASGTVHLRGKLEGQYCNSGEVGGQCVPIQPPKKFDLPVAVTEASGPASMSSSAVSYQREITPEVKKGVPEPVRLELRLSPTAARHGETVRVSITANLEPGWHTYSLTQQPIGGTPTEFDFDRLHHLKPLGEGFVAEQPFVLEQSGDATLEVHTRQVTWWREFEVESDTAGDYGLVGTMDYQLCNEKICHPPHQISFSLGQLPTESEAEPSPFAVVESNSEASPPEAPVAVAKPAELPEVANMPPAKVVQPGDQGLLAFLLLCVGGGFLALLTPCSFPMVPITVSFFLKQSERQHQRPWLLALVYCGSIVLAFTVLGVGIAAIFGAAKLNQLATNPWLNAVVGLVFVAFAFNMLGAFEIRVPSSLLTWTASHEGGGSYLGAVFMAMTFTLTSFTCTFAVVGTLLVSAANGQFYWPIVGMLAFGTAFSSPFFILALLPELLKKLPKSGGWMNSVKVVMGLIEIGAAIKFLSNADIGWFRTPVLLGFETVMLIWMVLALAIGAYLLGWFRFPHDTPVDSVSPGRGMLALSFFGLASVLAFLTLSPERADGLVMDQIVAFAPPRMETPGAEHLATGLAIPARSDLGPINTHHGLTFALDMKRAIPVARQERRPLLLDFTGVFCQNCRRMEKKMAEVANRERIAKFVAVQLYTDQLPPAVSDPVEAEQIKQANIELQLKWFGEVTLPMYAIVTPDGKDVLATYSGYAPGNEFTEFLDEGWSKWDRVTAQGGQGSTAMVDGR